MSSYKKRGPAWALPLGLSVGQRTGQELATSLAYASDNCNSLSLEIAAQDVVNLEKLLCKGLAVGGEHRAVVGLDTEQLLVFTLAVHVIITTPASCECWRWWSCDRARVRSCLGSS